MDAVSSPTFILVNLYRRADGAQLYHMDAYRLDSVPESEELDLDSMLSEGPLLIEWADRVKELIPKDHMWVELEYLA